MVKKIITDKIDNEILLFKQLPETYDNNIWQCYRECKKHFSGLNWKEYLDYVEYVTRKLDI
jgi:ribosomal protein L37AE/L43A